MPSARRITRRVDMDKLRLPFSVREVFGTQTLEEKYAQLGGEASLGPIVKKELGFWVLKDNCCLCYNGKLHAAFLIKGDIYKKWLLLGGLTWGIPCTDELSTPDRVGRFNHFNENSASIYWTPQTGACAIYGEIRKKWAELGWERSLLGYPITDELGTPDGMGRYNHFSNAGSIYWTSGTGAYAIWGDIRSKWESLGWEGSYLGYPTSDETEFPEGGRANTFQNGGIYWWADTGAIDLRDVIVQYTGLYCFGETDHDQSSGSDEPYVLVSITTPKIEATHKSKIYGSVDGKSARPDLMEIYRGKPYGINIGTVVMEHDFGDPNKYKKQVQDVVMKVHQAGSLALGLIPIVGPAIAGVAGPALGTLMPAIGGAISDLFNWGDDRIGSGNITLSARQMVLLAARTGDSHFKGIGFKAESPLISGQGASYKAYYGIVPA